MIYFSDLQKNMFLIVSVMIFSILIWIDGFDGLWGLLWFLVIYLFFVMIPVSKNLYYENGTGLQKLILSLLFILLSMDIFLSWYMISFNGVIISLFLIVFLNYTSTTLQISPKYHPIISTSFIMNIAIIILSVIALLINILLNLEMYYDIYISYALLIGLIILSLIEYTKCKSDFDKYEDNLMNNV